VFTACLKKYNPVLLTILLCLILGYVSYNEQSNFPIYTLLIFGIMIYVIDAIVVNTGGENISIWKVPFWGVLVYYIFYIKDNWISKKIEKSKYLKIPIQF